MDADRSAFLIDPFVVRWMTLPAPLAARRAAPGAGEKRPRSELAPGSVDGLDGPPPAKVSRLLAPPPLVSSGGMGVRLAVVVPFRDNPDQNRTEQLQRFAEYMPRFLSALPLAGFHIFIADQSQDGFKFNRGKVLNAGFAIARDSALVQRQLGAHVAAAGPFDAFCFHDVDLLPAAVLGPWYARAPTPKPLHMAAAWGRYGYEDYVGGIITFGGPDFARINGFPNNFWGWGGEDDELRMRMQRAEPPSLYPPERPSGEQYRGAITDIEDELLRTRGGQRAGVGTKDGGRAEWRNMRKREMMKWQKDMAHSDGLRNLEYRLLKVQHLNKNVTICTVDCFGEKDPFCNENRM
jgi:hypothetical protein